MHLNGDQTAALDKARQSWAQFGPGAVSVDSSPEIRLSFHLDDAERMLNRLSADEKFKIGEYITESVNRHNLVWVQQVLINRAGIVALWNTNLDKDQAREIGMKLLEAAVAAPN